MDMNEYFYVQEKQLGKASDTTAHIDCNTFVFMHTFCNSAA